MPDQLVVLTFAAAVLSHAAYVARYMNVSAAQRTLPPPYEDLK